MIDVKCHLGAGGKACGTQRKTLPVVALAVLLCLSGCDPMPRGGGPNPRAVLVVSANDYSTEGVLEPLDSLGARIDRSKEMIESGGRKMPRFSQFEVAYWYPDKGSDLYGVALVKWNIAAGDMANRFFVEVYAEEDECALCAVVKRALQEHHVSYFSACDDPQKSTPYEKIRCGE